MADNRKRYKCEMCGKRPRYLHDHHVIPWWFSHDDSDSNIMRLCSSCHGKADANFDNLVLRGKMSVAHDTRKRIDKRYKEKYIRRKVLYYFRLMKNTSYQDIVQYNIKTGYIFVRQQWRYRHHKYRNERVKSRAQLLRAASAKGQVTLVT